MTTQLNQTRIAAQIEALCNQRNAALNEVVNLAGNMAIANERINELESQLALAQAIIDGSNIQPAKR